MWRNASWYISYGILNTLTYTIFVTGYSNKKYFAKNKKWKNTLSINKEPELEINWSGEKTFRWDIQWDSQKDSDDFKNHIMNWDMECHILAG